MSYYITLPVIDNIIDNMEVTVTETTGVVKHTPKV